MGQAQPKRRTALIVEDDAELRILTAALLEEEQLDTIECESAEAALAVLLIGGQDIAMIFADVRLPGAMDGIDLAWEVKLRGRESRIPALASKDRLPRDLENSRNVAVTTAQTVWLPMSSCPVSQQPSRKNPVMGFIEQSSSRPPSTLRGAFGRPPPCPLSSLSIAISACDVADRLLIADIGEDWQSALRSYRSLTA
jgi:CheY-like chemotaxis protein